MRDYKFQRTTWTSQRRRRPLARLVLQLLLLVLAIGGGYLAFDHFGGHLGEAKTPANIIPLAIPPKPAGS